MGFIQLERDDSDMLSRVAESMYWMSRYLERAEHHARLIDVHLSLMLDASPDITQGRRLRRLLLSLDIDVPDVTELPDEEAVLRSLVFGTEDRTSLLQYLTSARENARQIREGISSEMWLQLNKLYLDVKQAEADDMWTQLPHRFLVQVREGSHLFQGLTDATMNHNQGWHFIQIGRYLERLIALVTFLNVQLQQGEDFRESDARNQYFELVTVLKSNSAFEAYCKVYNPDVQATRIVEFLLFNEQFPRSARFCVDTVLFSLDKLAEMTMRHKNQRVNRLAGRLQSLMNYDEIGDVLSGDFHDYLMNIKRQAYQIHESLYDAYITYKIESALK